MGSTILANYYALHGDVKSEHYGSLEQAVEAAKQDSTARYIGHHVETREGSTALPGFGRSNVSSVRRVEVFTLTGEPMTRDEATRLDYEARVAEINAAAPGSLWAKYRRGYKRLARANYLDERDDCPRCKAERLWYHDGPRGPEAYCVGCGYDKRLR